MKWIHRIKWAYISASVIMIAGGMVMVLYPALSMYALCTMMGIIAVLFGTVKVLGYFSKERYGLAFQFDLALGLFLMIAGILILLRTDRVILALPILLGVFFLLDGAFKLQTALDAKNFGMSRWWAILIFALLTCVGGLLLMLDPFGGSVALALLLGITLIIDGIQNLCIVVYCVTLEQCDKNL